MAAMFAGASRALLASVVFAFECTRQPIGLLPLLGGGSAAYLVSCLMMKNSIMTEKLARRGARVSSEYQADFLDGMLVRDFATAQVITLSASDTVKTVREFLATHLASAHHQGFPVLDAAGLIGVLTRRDLLEPGLDESRTVGTLVTRDAIVVHPLHSLRDAADRMAADRVGRVIVVPPEAPRTVVGILTRSDLLRAHEGRLTAGVERVRVRNPRLLRALTPSREPQSP
jgi:CBS domain-containing protein